MFKRDVFQKRYQQLQVFLRKRLQPEDAEDVIQTAFYKLVKADQDLLSPDWILAWLYRVASNESIDLLRKNKPIPFADHLSQEQHEFFDDTLAMMLASDDNPENEMLRDLFWTEFEATLNELPQEQRQAFEQTELLGNSFKKLSEETGVPVNTLISRKRYAVLRLRERLEKWRQEILNS